MSEMLYVSTRGGYAPKPFKEILLEGLAPDGGLYVPQSYPQLSPRKLQELRGERYVEVAFQVLRLYMPDIPPRDLSQIIAEAYSVDNFGSNDIVPIDWLSVALAIMKLSEGPTLSFKDIALQLVGRLMEYALAEKGRELNVLGATSGDTGSAAAYALRGRKGIRLFMLSPKDRMSPFQQAQMYTLNDGNIINIVVDGTFDECQALVKEINRDAAFKARYNIGAVNSINWARIAAQVVYYVYTWLRLTNDGVFQQVRFAVPSGNFGNALSAHVARQMGVPLETIVCTNSNDVLDDFFGTGVYRPRKEVLKTSSPSMDIALASNFERFAFDYAKRDPTFAARWWNAEQIGYFDVHYTRPGEVYGMTSGRKSEEEVITTIRDVYEKYGRIIDPHTAVAMSVAMARPRDDVLTVVAETAQPAKFADTIREAIGEDPPIPGAYRDLASRHRRIISIPVDIAEVKAIIAQFA